MKTFPDFVKLFMKHPAGGASMCFCMYHHRAGRAGSKEPRTWADRRTKNRREKRKLVQSGHAHGILVYANGEPVGWCQYGPREELPRLDSSHTYQDLGLEGETAKLWRITCFTVQTKYRRRGVATIALKAALEAIRKRGGGLVEAYPIVRWEAYHKYLGTVPMFRKEGFKIVAPLGDSNVVMRKKI